MTTEKLVQELRGLLAAANRLPWQTYDRGIGWEVHDDFGFPVNSECKETFARPDAALIVAAVNALPALLDALERDAAEIERLRDKYADACSNALTAAADKRRLDWLGDPNNPIGCVQLPTACVERNLHSLRDAIDDAMRVGEAG